MNQSKQLPHPKASNSNNAYQKVFAAEMMESEKLRANILCGIFLFSTFVFAIFTFLFPDRLFYIYQFDFPKMVPIYYFGAISFFYFVLGKRIKFAIREKIEVKNFIRYFGTLVETSIPSLSIFFLGASYGKQIIGSLTPPAFVYFFFIILSALRLDKRLSIFTGAVAGIEYLLLSMYALKITTNVSGLDPVFLEPPIYVAKSIMLLIAGIVAGFVTDQIRTGIKKTFQIVEERNRIANIFGQHVSPSVVEKLLNQSNEFSSETRHVCMMFLDIRNFTSFSEAKKPEEVVNYLNSVFESIVEIISKHNGIINKFLGDGFMAVFGAPIHSIQNEKNALNASIEIIEKLRQLERENLIHPTKVGIGLHSGEAVTGNVGSNHRKEYTIIGDVVNLASRIEQLNKQFDSTILISSEVFNRLDKAYGVLCGEVIVKGRLEPVKVYKVE
jgi:adenylate cyclase